MRIILYALVVLLLCVALSVWNPGYLHGSIKITFCPTIPDGRSGCP